MRRRLPALALALAVALPATALSASHQPPFKVRPSTVDPGDAVKVSGKPGDGCGPGSPVTIYSHAFPSGHGEFAGVPAVSAKVKGNGRFKRHVRIPVSKDPGTYSVGARCGGGNLGSRTLHVVPG
jgi:hypothetical protein